LKNMILGFRSLEITNWTFAPRLPRGLQD
jgi:hypothetical protein